MAEFYFNLPALTSPPLTNEQRSAINLPELIALSGGPGTGKSVVSLYRHLIKNQNGISCQLLTYTTSLAYYLRECCRLRNETAAENVGTIFSWAFFGTPSQRDEVIIDEAQDVKFIYKGENNQKYYFESEVILVGNSFYLKANKKGDNYYLQNSNIKCNDNFIQCVQGQYYSTDNRLERINVYHNLQNRYSISYGADNGQMVSNGTSVEELRTIFSQNRPFPLSKNFRNTKRILRFAMAAFHNAPISLGNIDDCLREGELPVLYKANEDEQETQIMQIIADWNGDAHNIAILCPWQKSVKQYYDLIKANYPDCTYYVSDNNGMKKISNIHVTTFKSAKGLEFDTVIIPDFDNAFKSSLTKYNITWKDYYVGVTRAKSNLFIFMAQDNYINIIKDFVDSENDLPVGINNSTASSATDAPEDDLPF